ncbi:SDR family NAD(P)-dependent oxidoreductase [Sharpea azabuensis]|uniref:3-oxoacyl-[acyl-carrier protein] reductase n=1 Tax=Sharpea azabuensis TaxID=322505 RepID=A0A1H6RYR0_9FIRM|nr:SDR family oxidoreductase [Sharpea azabuensis]MEE3309130.1 SDR family oxidoreductase [Sharpea azabuensis]SEI60779.1 3-oxoacyl-[acyl-carrier protein] reductase [Sharpea azabuensis]HCJ14234.1 KR domain-containing protein [Erysipelotrichaceae bacterium]
MAKVVLVTGGATGIGEAIVRELAQAGYDIAIAYHTSHKEAQCLLEDITSAYFIHARIYQVDVSCEDQVKQMMQAIDEEMGGVDILINNAAIDLPNLFELKTAEEFRKVLDVNVVGAYNCASALYRHFVDQEWGRIINIASTNGINTYYPMCFDYDASKAALISLTHNLALQYAPYVHVNAIAPGFIGTKHELEGYDEAFLKEECDKILVKRYGEPEEVAHLVKFLISDEANYINNAVIRIDGGQIGSV